MFDKQQTPILEQIHALHESHLQMLKDLGSLGENMKDLKQEFHDYVYGEQSELTILQPYEQTYYANGYNFNSLYISDNAVNDTAKLVVQVDAITYTLTLTPGENAVNLPHLATYKVTTTSGNPVPALLKRYNLK